MKLTAQVKLSVTPTQADALKRTLLAANAICDKISAWAWETITFSQFPVHKGQYAIQRAESGLNSQVVARCVSKVADAYKLDKQTQRTFLPLGAIAYDDRILTWYVDKGFVSIWTVDGRMKLHFECGDYQRGLLAFRQGEADLAFVKGKFYLLATVGIPDPTSQSCFRCLSCGYQANADYNASRNIERKGLEARANVRTPIVATRTGLC